MVSNLSNIEPTVLRSIKQSLVEADAQETSGNLTLDTVRAEELNEIYGNEIQPTAIEIDDIRILRDELSGAIEKQRMKLADFNKKYVGVGGWLSLFVAIHKFLRPIFGTMYIVFIWLSVGSVISLLPDAGHVRSILIAVTVLDVFIIVYGIIISRRLEAIKPRAVQATLTFLVISGVVSLAEHLSLASVDLSSDTDVLRSLFWVGIWLIYFTSSKRVKATYNSWIPEDIAVPDIDVAVVDVPATGSDVTTASSAEQITEDPGVSTEIDAGNIEKESVLKVQEKMIDGIESDNTDRNPDLSAGDRPRKRSSSWKLYAILLLIINVILLAVVLVFIIPNSSSDPASQSENGTNYDNDGKTNSDYADMQLVDDLRRNPETNRGRRIESLTMDVWMVLDNGNLWCKAGEYPKQLDVIISGPNGSSYRDAVAHAGAKRYYEADVLRLHGNARFVGLSSDNYVVIEIMNNQQSTVNGGYSEQRVGEYGTYDDEQEGERRSEIRESVYQGQYPDVSMRIVSRQYLYRRTKNELRIMRNEIFARHGYRFKTADLKEYFEKQYWYTAKYDDVSNMLTDIERANIKLIIQYE